MIQPGEPPAPPRAIGVLSQLRLRELLAEVQDRIEEIVGHPGPDGRAAGGRAGGVQ